MLISRFNRNLEADVETLSKPAQLIVQQHLHRGENGRFRHGVRMTDETNVQGAVSLDASEHTCDGAVHATGCCDRVEVFQDSLALNLNVENAFASRHLAQFSKVSSDAITFCGGLALQEDGTEAVANVWLPSNWLFGSWSDDKIIKIEASSR